MPNKVAEGGRDAAIARVAARQHGVVTRSQLVAVGLLPGGISDRVKAGRLHRIHRGVYAVGHPRLSKEGLWMAAVLACGEGAALSHRSAAEHRGIMPTGRRQTARQGGVEGPVDVVVAGDGGRMQRWGIRVHRSITLSPADLTTRAGIRVTKPARTLE